MPNKIYIAELDAKNDAYLRKLSEAEAKTITSTNKIKSSTDRIGSSFAKIGAVIGAYFSGREILSFAQDAVQLASKMQGVQAAFNRLGNSTSILQRLRQATQGTISDLQLMQAAVKADNFKISTDLLAKGLEFANKRAIQTGEAVDYMVDSFITGVARKSIPILDNLGISQNDLNKEVLKTGDFYTAIGNIVEQENIKMSSSIDNTVIAQQRLNATLENTKISLGEKLLPLYNAFLGISNELVSNFGSLNTFMTGGGFMLNEINNIKMNAGFSGNTKPSRKNQIPNLLSRGKSIFTLQGASLSSGMDFTPTGNQPGGNAPKIFSGGDASNRSATSLFPKRDFTPTALGFQMTGNKSMSGVPVPEFDPLLYEDTASKFIEKFSEVLNISNQMANIFNASADSFVGKLSSAVDTVSSILSLADSAASLFGVGSALAFAAGAVGLKDGGTVINKNGKISLSNAPHFASGVSSFRVPPGYPNDSFPIMVQSGERVDVTAAGHSGSEKLLSQVIKSIQAMNLNLVSTNNSRKRDRIELESKIAGTDIYMSNKYEARYQTRLRG